MDANEYRPGEQLKESEGLLKRYLLLLQHARDIILFVRAGDGRIIEANEAAIKEYAYTKDELLSRTIKDLRDPSTFALIPSQLVAAVSGGLAFETLHRRKDGTSFPVEVSSSGVEINGERILLSIIRNLTEHKKIERDLQHNNRLLDGILQAIPDVVYFKDRQGAFLYVNRVFEQTWDLSAQHVLGKNNDQVLPPGARETANASDRKVFEQGVVIHHESEVTTPHGIRSYETVKIPLISEQGITTGLVGISRDITEHKISDAQIKSAHRLLDLTLASLEEAVFVIFPATRRIELVNDAAERMFGYTKDEMIGNSANSTAFLHVNEEMYDRFRRDALTAMKTTGHFKTELKMKRKNGEIFLSEHFAKPTIDEHGDILNIVSVVRDITERKRAEETLRLSEEKYRDLFENAVDAIFIVDDQFRYVDVNKRAMELFGYTREEFLSMSIFDSMPSDQIPRSQEELKNLQNRGRYEKFIGKSRTKDGTWLDVEVSSAAIIIDGRIVGSRDVVRDITERKRAEETLVSSQKSLQAVVDSVDAIVYVADMQTYELLLMNKYSRNIFGEVLGGKCWQTLQKDQQGPCSFCTNSKLVGTDGQPLDTYVWEFQNTITGRWYECRDKAIRWIDGCIVRMEIAADISDRKKLEQELIRSQKLESVSILAGGIAHDFNNLLQGIIGNIALAKMYAGGGGKLHDRLQDAEETADKAKELSYRLLTFAKGGAPARQIQHIDSLIKNSFNMVLFDPHIQSEFDIAADLHTVEVDEGQMTQVFRNLAINAKEAMTSGGMIRVRARNVTVTSKDNLPVSDGEYVRISVEDQGVGIPPENLSKIFDPYFTTKEISSQKGLGLGLAVCYSVVKKHHGVITVESTVGHGSTFHTYLPASPTATPAGIMKADSAATAIRKARILVMDDEVLVRNIVKEILVLLGYDSVLTQEGDEAVREYQYALTTGKPFDLVLLDLTIPGGMGGIDTLRKLQEINPAVRVIVSSGYADDPIMKNYRAYGFVSALTKPYSVEQLRVAILTVLNPEAPGP